MNKSELIAAVAEDVNVSKAVAGRVLESAFVHIIGATGSTDGVAIKGFGNFTVKRRPARPGRNPRTGEAIQLAATVTPKFSPAKAFKDQVSA